MESNSKNKLKIVVPVVLGTGLLVSLGVNGWLYSQLSSMNVTGMQTELSTIQTEYEALSQKIEQGKQSLTAIQEENSQLKQEGLQEQVEVILEKPSASPPKYESNKGTVKQTPRQSSESTGGNTGGATPLRPEIDKNQNGIADALEENFAGEGTIIINPGIDLGTNP